MSGKKGLTLQGKTAIIVALAFILAVITYFGITNIGDFLINKIYLSEEQCAVRQEQYNDKFKKFVRDNKIASDDGEKIQKWCSDEQYLYISILKGGETSLETDGTFVQLNDVPEPPKNYQLNPDYEAVSFSDGVYEVSVIEFTESRYYDPLSIVAFVLAFIVLLYVILMYNRSIIRKIIRLSEQVRQVRDGKPDLSIIHQGKDEFAQLCGDVDEMRSSIITHYEREQEAWRANTELLTSISHDIRTPLTSVVGYSEILAEGQYDTDEELTRYAQTCRDKAYQLKELTDTLFKYFLVFSNPDIPVNSEKYSAVILLEQLLGEHIIYLAEKGWPVNTVKLKDDFSIMTDISLLKRVFDNVFSNIEKYADKEKEITVYADTSEQRLEITIINHIAILENEPQSTKIGLKTCSKIMEMLSGMFEYRREQDIFITVIGLPLQN